MKTRGIIGKRIVRIAQRRIHEAGRPTYMDVQTIELEDGTILWPVVGELEADYAVDFGVKRPRRKRRPVCKTEGNET
jgi:hypothetical protein